MYDLYNVIAVYGYNVLSDAGTIFEPWGLNTNTYIEENKEFSTQTRTSVL